MSERPLLIVDESTTCDDLVRFLCQRAQPTRCAGSAIYDLNNHPFDAGRFEASGLPAGTYLIPFSMSEVNLDLFALLPLHIAALPRLRFNPRAPTGGYTVMPSLVPVDEAVERRATAQVEQAFAVSG